MEDLRKRLESRDLKLEITDAALDKLVAQGFDPVYGARPLKRAIQSSIENPLAEKILSGKFLPGQTIKLDAGDLL
jgi:ATP-dependent Clp protease ATP-binding subunit ClpB